MRAVILGGTFNPVHFGHLFIAETVREELGYEKVILVPANKPVHKDDTPVLDPAHRLAMLALAVEGNPHLIVDDCDIRRGGKTYSIETVTYLVSAYSISGKPGFIIGDDLVAGYASWKEAERLAAETDLIVVRRTSEGPLPFVFPHRLIMNPMLPISSSEIRRRVVAGRSVRYLLPDAIIAYMEAHRLYV